MAAQLEAQGLPGLSAAELCKKMDDDLSPFIEFAIDCNNRNYLTAIAAYGLERGQLHHAMKCYKDLKDFSAHHVIFS